MEREEIKKLANLLMFDVNEDEITMIENSFKTLDKQIELLDKVDTEGVEVMVYPFDVETTYLREDEVSHVSDKEDVLANVAKVKEGHVVVPRVLK